MNRFGSVSDNTYCHDNALNTFGLKILDLERGAIKPMLPQLHFNLPPVKAGIGRL